MRLGLGLGIGSVGGGLPPVVLSPANPSKAAYATQTFTATGGTGTGYTYSLTSAPSGGSIDGTGHYTAGGDGGTDVVRVVDSGGNVGTTNVTAAAYNFASVANLIALYDARSGFTPAQWNDLSGNGNHAVQASGALQPALNPTWANGQPAVADDGSGMYMRCAAFAGGDIAQPHTILIVGAPNSAGGTQAVIDGVGGAKRSLIYAVGNQVDFYAGANVGTSEPWGVSNVKCLAVVFDGATSKLYRGTTLVTTDDAGTHVMSGVTLFANGVLSTFMNGNIALAMVVSGAIAPGDLTKVVARAHTIWGTPLT